jgi:glycosyltransferase involved in cell wall biosynthesis
MIMKKILYLNNFMSRDIVKVRNNENIYSQPANNKINGILTSLQAAGCEVKILSSGLVNSKSFKKYPKMIEPYCGTEVVYCSIIDIPLLNTLSSIRAMYKEIKKEYKKRKVDNIIFYNYKPEVAWAAYFAKLFLKIPITIEYEDGYSYVDNISPFKRFMLRATEQKISKRIDSAILVTSLMEKYFRVPSVVVRGVINVPFFEECKAFQKTRNNKFTVLYSGGLDESRGINVLLKALDYCDFDFKLIITGKGMLDYSDPRIDFKGFVSHEEVKCLMMEADVLVQCQLANHDFGRVSFPSKLFEYIATGNNIISSHVSDVKQFAGDSLLYYENDDPRELAFNINKLFTIWDNNYNLNNPLVRKLCRDNIPSEIGLKIKKILN